MELKKELYTILKEMVYFAQLDDKYKVIELNRDFDIICEKLCNASPSEVELEFDNCRQACMFSVFMPENKQRFLDDAQSRFAQIPTENIKN